MWAETFFHELSHFFTANLLSIFVFWKFRSKKMILVIFTATFLLDLDHLFDYFYFAGNLKFWEYFGGVDFFVLSEKVFVPLHSWELTIFLGILGWVKRLPLVLAVSLAMAGHILVDQFSYTSNLLAYFLIFRAVNDFSLFWFNN